MFLQRMACGAERRDTRVMKYRAGLSAVGAILISAAAGCMLQDKEEVEMAPPSEPPPLADPQRQASADTARDVGEEPPETRTVRVGDFEAVMNRYYRGDPLEKARRSLNGFVDKYNQWVESARAQHEAARTKLEGQIEPLRGLQKQIEDLDRRLAKEPDPQDQVAVEAYNTLVAQRNELVTQYNDLGKSCKQSEAAYNDSVARFQQEMKARQDQLDAQRATVEQEIEAHKRWSESEQGLSFFRELNRFYAQLHEQRRAAENPEMAETMDKARTIRRELAEHALRRQEKADSGLLIVEATLCRREKCFLIVDTGATVVSISPALVDVLELSDQLGKETEVSLAGGIRIKGRELVIPQLSVLGMEAEDVRAVVIDEPEVGVDGLLGLSFLNRFTYRIEQQQPHKLILEPRSEE